MNAYLTIQQVADRLGVPVTTLRNWVYRPSPAHNFPRPDRVVAKQRAGRWGEWHPATVDAWRARNV